MSLNIDPQTENDLAKLADMQNISVNALLRGFTVKQNRYWEECTEDMNRLQALQENGGIAHEDMKAHLRELKEAARARL